MNIRRIVTPSDPLYADCVRIYENSFPYAERRDTAGMTEYLKDDRLHFLAFYGDREEDGPYGFFYILGLRTRLSVRRAFCGGSFPKGRWYRHGCPGLYQRTRQTYAARDRVAGRG